MTTMQVYELRPGPAPADTALFTLLSAYQDSLSVKMNDIIVENKVPLSKTQPESTMGNWISDAARSCAYRRGLRADICLFSYGCIGKEYLGPGPLLRKDFYELLPFENNMILVSLSGAALQQLCDSIAHINGLPVSGLSFVIDSGRARHIKVGAEPLNEYRIYTLLLNDYLYSRYAAVLGKLRYQRTNTRLTLRKLLMEECIELQHKGMPVHSVLEKRIVYAE